MDERGRKFWQIHLSTALLSMLLASMLLGYNLVERDVRGEYQAWYAKDYDAVTTWGWPFRYGEVRTVKAGTAWVNTVSRNPDGWDALGRARLVDWEQNAFRIALANFGACASLTLAFAALCEFSIRLEVKRRTRRAEVVQVSSV